MSARAPTLRPLWISGALAVPMVALIACSGTPSGDRPTPREARPSVAADAAARCPAIAQQAAQAVPGLRVGGTEFVQAGTMRPSGAQQAEFLPEHCIVNGSFDHRTGVDGKPYAIGIELRLPTRWSGRFMFQGGGGNDGVVAPAVGRNTGALAAADNALARGFAVVSTDAGHAGSDASFGLDPQARIDHAYNSYDRVATTAKALLENYYGRPSDVNYFVGCSGGGRQGMMFSQRFPSHFDGIVAVAPAMRVAKGASINAAHGLQRFSAIAPKDAAGKPILAQAMSPSDMTLLAGAATAACDADDGAKDGLVSHPEACRFDPAVLACSGTKEAGCLSAAQVDAVKAFFAGPKNRAGEALYFPWPWDPGIAAPGWRAWVLGTAPAGDSNALYARLIAGAVAYEFLTPPAPGFDLMKFDFDADPPRMDAYNAIYTTAADDKLTAYKARGGKLLLMHGMSDPIFSANESIDYQRRLAANHGGLDAVQSFSRLFLVPGMTHCAGGPATDAFDGLGAIVRWVEQGEAPQSILAKGTTVLPGVSRPLCPYPKHTHYKGTGDPRDAANHDCR